VGGTERGRETKKGEGGVREIVRKNSGGGGGREGESGRGRGRGREQGGREDSE